MKLKQIQGFEGTADHQKGVQAVSARHEGGSTFQLAAVAPSTKPQSPSA